VVTVPQTSLRVLLVDDCPGHIEVMQLELCRHGFKFQARVAGTRAEFLTAIMEGPWDLVLSGLSMAGLGSTEALRLLRARDADVPFIVVSGIGEDASGEAVSGGAQDHALTHNLRQLGPAVEHELREAANHRMQRSTEAALQEWNIAFGTRNVPKT
jgi:DNA-binding NtrC family response regulator